MSPMAKTKGVAMGTATAMETVMVMDMAVWHTVVMETVMDMAMVTEVAMVMTVLAMGMVATDMAMVMTVMALAMVTLAITAMAAMDAPDKTVVAMDMMTFSTTKLQFSTGLIAILINFSIKKMPSLVASNIFVFMSFFIMSHL